MKEIPLTQGKVALVDDEDYEFLSQFKWKIQANVGGSRCYAARGFRVKGNGRKLTLQRMHRVIMGVTDRQQAVDHINGNSLDNRRCNLRLATCSQNNANQQIKKHTSQYKGVSWHQGRKRWLAGIQWQRKQYYLGWFDREIDAAHAYDQKARELFGEFAKTNL